MSEKKRGSYQGAGEGSNQGRRDFLKSMVGTVAAFGAGSAVGSEKVAAQERPKNYYEGLPEALVNEMKQIDSQIKKIEMAFKVKDEKLRLLMELWNEKKETSKRSALHIKNTQRQEILTTV